MSSFDALTHELTRIARPDDPDREALAHLRRGLCGTADYTLSRVGWLFRGIDNERDLDAAVLAAGLFAWVRGDCPNNGGASFGQAFGSGLSDEDKEKREKRFVDLLDTDREALPYKLRQAITLIRGIGLDWAMLMRDIAAWDHPRRCVQKDWARGFWANPRAESDATENDE